MARARSPTSSSRPTTSSGPSGSTARSRAGSTGRWRDSTATGCSAPGPSSGGGIGRARRDRRPRRPRVHRRRRSRGGDRGGRGQRRFGRHRRRPSRARAVRRRWTRRARGRLSRRLRQPRARSAAGQSRVWGSTPEDRGHRQGVLGGRRDYRHVRSQRRVDPSALTASHRSIRAGAPRLRPRLGCASSTATATSTPTGSTSDADQVVGGARLAGVERILVPGWNVASSERALDCVERFAWLDAAVGVHPHDAAKVDDAGWDDDRRPGRRPARGRDRRDRARLRPRLQPDPGPAGRTSGGTWRSRSRPASRRSSTAARRSAVATPRTRSSASCARPGVGGPAWAAAFGERPPAVIHSFSGPRRLRADRHRPRARGQLLGARLPGGRGGLGRGRRDRARRSRSWSRPIRRSSRRRAPHARATNPSGCASQAAWLAARRETSRTTLGPSLVAAYDRTFPSPRRISR